MIFENINDIASWSIQEKRTHFGKFSKAPYSNKRHRSNMMLNPLNLKHLNRIDELESDWITLNLEDAIAPSRKEEALVNIALFISHLKNSSSAIVVRVNPLELGGDKEIELLNNFSIDAIRLPKVKTLQDIKKALKLLPKDRELHISLETKEAFRELEMWGGVDSRLTTANLGILDLLADLKLPQRIATKNPNNPTALAILSRFLIGAKIAGVLPVSFMYQDYRDIEGFRLWCEKEKEMGFEAKACMGPAQVEIANEIFGVSESELIRARVIKDEFEKHSKQGINGFMHNEYGFIDEPIYRDAINILKNS